ncbi:UNVERIFIED_CONTAM: hypothetical protein H355_007749, partial [Colinus virginianus]
TPGTCLVGRGACAEPGWDLPCASSRRAWSCPGSTEGLQGAQGLCEVIPWSWVSLGWGRGRDLFVLLQMECPEELESRLLTQPWASVCFGESAFIAKACFGDTGYTLLISDLSGVWYESADAEAVGQRSKELNKRLTASVSSVVQLLRSLLCPVLAGQPHAATSFSCQRPAGGLSLRVRSELSGLPFSWDFRCRPAPVPTVSRAPAGRFGYAGSARPGPIPARCGPTHSRGRPALAVRRSGPGPLPARGCAGGFRAASGLLFLQPCLDTWDPYRVCRHLVCPLMRMSLALQHQVQELTSLLLQKDAEIEDYRESGATLSRGEEAQAASWHALFPLAITQQGLRFMFSRSRGKTVARRLGNSPLGTVRGGTAINW